MHLDAIECAHTLLLAQITAPKSRCFRLLFVRGAQSIVPAFVDLMMRLVPSFRASHLGSLSYWESHSLVVFSEQ